MANFVENQNLKLENSNIIKEDEFKDTQLPLSSDLKTPNINSNISYTTTNNNNNNNSGKNRHIVSFGILIVLLTLYVLTAAAFQLQSNQSISDSDEHEILTLNELKQKEERRQAMILDKLLEHKDICSELEIFVKNFKLKNFDEDTNNNNCDGVAETEIEKEIDTNEDKQNYIQRKKTISNRKHINGKKLLNGQNGKRNKNNKSIKSTKKFNKKYLANKKDDSKKKTTTTTAEPIIYLFALVLIYLLFKAASDINQHYKAQAKGDKRLRRCSLQSYAQAHKQDRRASKDHHPLNVLKRKNQLLENRTQSLDRFTKPLPENSNEKIEFLRTSLRKHISMDEPIPMEIQNFKNLHESNIPNQAERKIFNTSVPTLTENNISKNRRCSVPALLISQKPQIGSSPAILLTSRRTSIIPGGTNNFDNVDPLQFSETSKRRVRMINRH